MSELSKLLSGLKKQFLAEKKNKGGNRKAFRQYVGKRYAEDPQYFVKLALDAWMEAANLTWERQPRKFGPDLFSISGYTVPEFLTRPTRGIISTSDDEEIEDVGFEKVDSKFATVQDMIDDATLHLRKAAQSAAAAEEQMKAADEARRRAGNNLAAFLRDIADKPDAAAAD